MRYLAPLLFVLISFTCLQLHAGETSIEAALEKARQRAGAPPSDAQAKQKKSQEAVQRKAREENLRKQREEAERKAKAEAEQSETSQPATSNVPISEPVNPKIKVFKLKDGRQIEAVMVIELDDTYALKDTDGKLQEVRKDEVQSVGEAHGAPDL